MKPTTVTEYESQLSGIAKERFRELRDLLKTIAPEAKEVLKWGKPVFESKTILFAYSSHKNHLSFIPTGPALLPFQKELQSYTTKQDSIQLPHNEPFPADLIKKIATHRKMDVEVNDAKWKY